MDTSSVCVIDPLHACRCCMARGPLECPYRYLLADATTIDRWTEASRGATTESLADGSPPRV
jgi:hypothetical protein